MKFHHHLITALSGALILSSPVLGQAPGGSPPPPPPVSVVDFKVENAQAPGGGNWLRLLAPFRSSPKWADGVVFHYDILLERGGQYRVLTGSARYANVKAGTHAAVLYLSPSTVERFGAPIAARIGGSYDEEGIPPFEWSAAGREAPDGWSTQYERYPGLLQPIYLTPFVATEYGKYPDAIGTR